MKTKSELIAKAMKAAVKAANGGRVVLTVGTTVYTNQSLAEVKPKTETIWFALGIPVRTTTGHRTFSSAKSLPDLLAKMTYYGFDPLGKIESREVEIKP